MTSKVLAEFYFSVRCSDSEFGVLDGVPSVSALNNGINPDVEFLKSSNLFLELLESSSIGVHVSGFS